jgi:hypothetical protein
VDPVGVQAWLATLGMSGVVSAGELCFLFIALAPNQWLLFGAR